MYYSFEQWWDEFGDDHPVYKWENEERKEQIKKFVFDAWCAAIGCVGYLSYTKDKNNSEGIEGGIDET